MKYILKFSILIITSILLLNSHSFAQTKKDSLKHWSIGVTFSPGFYPYRQFPDLENNGLPLQTIQGYNLRKCNKGNSISEGLFFSYYLNKKFSFQFTFLNTKENIKYIGVNIHISHGSSWGGIRIYKYNLNYFESNYLVRYHTIIKKRIDHFVSMGLNFGSIYMEYIEENLSNPYEFKEKNHIFKFNRIVPGFGTGLSYKATDAFYISLAGNISWIPLYQKRNTYEYTNGIKLSSNFGIHYNF